MTFSLLLRSPCTETHHCLIALWEPHTTSYLGKHLCCLPLISPQRTSPVEEQPTTAISPTLAPKQSPRPKRQQPLPDSMESTPIGNATPKATSGGPPIPKRQETPQWFTALKPNHAKAFSQDSNMVKEARREYFSKALP